MNINKKEPYIYRFVEDDGSIITWKFDHSQFIRGPIEVNIEYPKNYIEEETNLKSKKTEQTYLNPANGKYVGYGRAKSLGLI
jgi:hypothetical protein